MQFFKKTPNFQFLKHKKGAIAISCLFILASIVLFFAKGINYGIDFRGGTLVQIQLQQDPPLAKIRALLESKLPKQHVEITKFGGTDTHELLLTLSQNPEIDQKNQIVDQVKSILITSFPKLVIRRIETIGPKVGNELKTKAFWASILSLIGILIYVGFRFHITYGIGAVAALFHDVIITLGFYMLANMEFSLTTVAALLTIIGYSLNDTIVVFDRVRENIGRFPKLALEGIVDRSVNESLSRTLLTSFTTFLVVLILFLFGGNIMHTFAYTMLIGLIVGTYSSVFIASPIMIVMKNQRKK